MSRIIKEGTLQERIMDCPKCGCQFGYDVRDIWSENYDPPIHGVPERYYVECPYCHEHLPLSVGEKPKLSIDNDFMVDVEALAKQYGLELINVEVKTIDSDETQKSEIKACKG